MLISLSLSSQSIQYLTIGDKSSVVSEIGTFSSTLIPIRSITVFFGKLGLWNKSTILEWKVLFILKNQFLEVLKDVAILNKPNDPGLVTNAAISNPIIIAKNKLPE